MSGKKIILVSPAHPLRGGIAASSERLAMALQQAGHEVVIYSFSLQYPAFLFPGKTQYTDGPAPKELIIRTRLNSVNPLNWLLSGWKIGGEKPDRIIVRFWIPLMGPCLGTVLRIARLRRRRPLSITALVDNIIPHEKRPGDRLFSRYFTGACDDFVVMSRSVGEEIRQFSSRPVRYAPHPLYDAYGPPVPAASARQQLRLPEKSPLLLFFGFVRKYKGLDLLLQAMALQPEVSLVVAGECYEDWSEYNRIIEEMQLRQRVFLFNDFIPAEQVKLFFSAADLVVQPYKTATQSGISQIAYHFEKPMVVTRVGGLPEIVSDGISGYVVDPAPEAIAAAIGDFFDKNRASAMQAGAREEKKRFSWENLVRACLDEKV